MLDIHSEEDEVFSTEIQNKKKRWHFQQQHWKMVTYL